MLECKALPASFHPSSFPKLLFQISPPCGTRQSAVSEDLTGDRLAGERAAVSRVTTFAPNWSLSPRWLEPLFHHVIAQDCARCGLNVFFLLQHNHVRSPSFPGLILKGPRGKVTLGWNLQACKDPSPELQRDLPKSLAAAAKPVAGVAKLELEVEFRRFGAAAAGQRLLQAETPAQNEQKAAASRRSGRARSVLRWFSTAVLYAAFLGLGTTVAILGPTFPDLARNVNRNVSSLSEIFVGRALGYLCGSVVGGVLFDCMNHFLLLGMSMLATTIGLYLIPFCKTATLLIATMSVFGVSFGALDTGANVLILALWGDKGAPHMQALHFSFALGAFLAPLLAKLAWGTTASTQNHTECDFNQLMLNRSSEATSDSLFAVPEDMNLLWAYASIGTYVLVVSVFLFGLFCKQRSRQKKSMASGQRARRAKYHRALLCLLFFFFFFYVGAEVTYGSYIFTFATTHVGMEESEAAGLNSVFWGTFAACRGLAIFFATLLQPGTMIVLSNIGSFVSTFFLVLFHKSPLCLWIATSVYGASLAATFPSGVSWIEQYTTLTGKSTAFFVIGGTLGEMAIPAVIGMFQRHYPELPVVLYTCFASAISTAVLFPVMYKLANLPL